ncbi:MAG: ABC transporter substrate-binding protein [Cyclobacteriaceae bacterium]|nr:ABC transporter substrate-binding protein [Cyclobacteriaceae bacterium]
MKKILFILLIFIGWQVHAQETIDFNQQYLNAKTSFKEGRYGLARNQFEKLAEPMEGNSFAENASFYAALSAYKEGFNALAKDKFLEHLSKYPSWKQNNEVFHWLSYIYFENQDPYQALAFSEKITNRDIRKTNVQIQEYFIPKINDIDSLMDLYNVFPENEFVALQLANSITHQPFTKRDFVLLNDLIKKYKSIEKKFGSEITKNEKKESYTISLMMPFILDQLKIETRPKVNEFILEFYRGFQIAADSINKNETKLNILVFDTKRDTTVIKSQFNSPELQSSDLIIGPVFNSGIIQDFSFQNQINTINPFSKNDTFTEVNPFYYLYSYPYRKVGENLAHFTASDTLLQKGIIFHANNSQDSLIAKVFADSMINSGKEILGSYVINKGEGKKVLNLLTGVNVVNDINENSETALPQYDFVFVSASQNAETLYSDILSATEIRNDNIRIIGSHNWLEGTHIDLNKLEKLNVVFAGVDLINYTCPAYIKFEQTYLERFGKMPGKYSAIGYDLLMSYSELLFNHGRYFQLESKNTDITVQSPFSIYYDVNFSNYNSFIPIIQWNGQVIEVLNKEKTIK